MCKLSCCFANLNLLLLTVSFVVIACYCVNALQPPLFQELSNVQKYSHQDRAGFLGIQYIGVFNFRYTVLLFLKLDIKYSSRPILGIKYTVSFLILVFYMSFSIIFGILEGLFQVFWYSTTPPPPADPVSLTKRRSILFSGTNLSGRKTHTGPVAGHYKDPILPFGLGLKAFYFSSDNVS